MDPGAPGVDPGVRETLSTSLAKLNPKLVYGLLFRARVFVDRHRTLLKVTPHEFIRRFLQHVLPCGHATNWLANATALGGTLKNAA